MEEPVPVKKLCASVDVLPTVLNLLGVTYDSRILAGHDILSDSEELVIFADHSFKTDKIGYNTKTGEVTYYVDEKQFHNPTSTIKSRKSKRNFTCPMRSSTPISTAMCTAGNQQTPQQAPPHQPNNKTKNKPENHTKRYKKIRFSGILL